MVNCRVQQHNERHSSTALLEIRGLHVVFDTYYGLAQALSGIEFDLERKKITGLVGETGCGKSVTAKAILQLIQRPGRIVRGEILLEGEDLLLKSYSEMEAIRGSEISMVFQSPRASLNPLFTIEDQMHYILKRHHKMSRKQARMRILEGLREVGIPAPEKRLRGYPFELSTGMCQRVMIAMALLCRPRLLIADEPTTGLDVTIQAQILDLFGRLVDEHGSTALVITHNLGVVAETCDFTGVMYAGRIVEYGSTVSVFENTAHPYTRGLLASCLTEESSNGFRYIPGSVPDLINLRPGCAFFARCDQSTEACQNERPKIVRLSQDHWASCWNMEANS